ncbi:MAG: hypothetical protein RR382_12480, partial [Tannerellaceae bacterium]
IKPNSHINTALQETRNCVIEYFLYLISEILSAFMVKELNNCYICRCGIGEYIGFVNYSIVQIVIYKLNKKVCL